MIKNIFKYLNTQSPKKPAIGATVLMYQCNGCMAEQHDLQWVGEILHYGKDTIIGGDRLFPTATVGIIKKGNKDIRDGTIGTYKLYYTLDNLQRLYHRTYALFK